MATNFKCADDAYACLSSVSSLSRPLNIGMKWMPSPIFTSKSTDQWSPFFTIGENKTRLTLSFYRADQRYLVAGSKLDFNGLLVEIPKRRDLCHMKKSPENAQRSRAFTCNGEASLTFGHANANFSMFIDRVRSQFLKKWIMIIVLLICIAWPNCRARFATVYMT